MNIYCLETCWNVRVERPRTSLCSCFLRTREECYRCVQFVSLSVRCTMLVHPKWPMSPQFWKGGPVGATYSCSRKRASYWRPVVLWPQHLKNCVKPSNDDPVLLVLGNHASHISLWISNYCNDNGIIIVYVPSHTCHPLQTLILLKTNSVYNNGVCSITLLYLTFYGPLKAAFNMEWDLCLERSGNEKITQYLLAEVFSKAKETDLQVLAV